jgi:hypothetical protein
MMGNVDKARDTIDPHMTRVLLDLNKFRQAFDKQRAPSPSCIFEMPLHKEDNNTQSPSSHQPGVFQEIHPEYVSIVVCHQILGLACFYLFSFTDAFPIFRAGH